jgi:hypothetical protein
VSLRRGAQRSRHAQLPLFLACLAAAVLLLPQLSAAGGRTEYLRYSPYAADGTIKPGLRVVPRSGECFSSSITDPRSDTWRCAADYLYDPCFESRLIRNYVICVPAPWKRKVFGIKGRLDRSGRYPARPHAWAIVLVDGRKCVYVAGATTVVHGKRLNFFCGRHAYLFGLPKGGHSLRRIYFSRSSDGPLHLVKIKRIWR